MSKKKVIIISIVVVAIISILGFGGYSIFFKQDENSTLTLIDKKWIEDNKNTIVDLGIVNNIPILSYEGTGVLFDFVSDLEEDTELEFNKVSYEIGNDIPSEYSFMFTDKVEDNDIFIYKDNYTIFGKENVKYNSLYEIPAMTIGVLSDDLGLVNYYLKENGNLQYKSYDNVTEMTTAMGKGEISGMALSQIYYFGALAAADNGLYDIYNITEMGKTLVLRLGSENKLNEIIRKYYKKWEKESFEQSYISRYSEMYFLFNSVTEQQKTKFKSKSYVYGFVNYTPYDRTVNQHLEGINKEIIKEFAKTANIDVKYKEYGNINELVKAFNQNKVDFMMDLGSFDEFDLDVIRTVSVFDEKLAIISPISCDVSIHSISSLYGKKVAVLKDSKISAILKSQNIEYKEYATLKDMLNSNKKDTILVVDYATYDTYARTILKNYKLDYIGTAPYQYTYIARDIEDNKLFNSYFNFYLSFMNEQSVKKLISYKTFTESLENNTAFYVLVAGCIILLIMFIVLLKSRAHGKKKNVSISKESKLRYIDMLTSLKNRNYLNDSISKWDESEVYPQAIIIIDLNNIAYINDNYGHEEGDKVITEAANILIKSQIENSEIVRTNGNEFLIYMVEYDEKQVVSYIRKLTKEFKDLSHGFGAALGYSIIQDGIKTIDDAINEATLDMRSNKEETNN